MIDTDPCILIPLRGGKHRYYAAVVEAESLDLICGYTWYARKGVHTFYAEAPVYEEGQKTTISMQKLIFGDVPDGLFIDHVNRNGLDNRRHNLRLATKAQNAANSIGKSGGTSHYKGVWRSSKNRWTAEISSAGRRYRLGSFADEADAAHAYDVAARDLFGEHAYLNFPDEIAS